MWVASFRWVVRSNQSEPGAVAAGAVLEERSLPDLLNLSEVTFQEVMDQTIR